MNYFITIQPLFKYIGGKSWLKKDLSLYVIKHVEQSKFSTYIEPFAGGLGAFLSIYDILLKNNIHNVILSDINETLIHTYQCIQNNPNLLIQEFLKIENEFVNKVDHNWINKKNKNELKECLKNAEFFFNQIKKEFNQNKFHINIQQSARFIFLQKHAFNGIYRENSKGEYNTPFNWSGSNMLNTIEYKIQELHHLFHKFNLQFICQSFEKIDYHQNALYYLDPPYINDNFLENKYHADSFNLQKQILLIEKIKNSNFIYSNHKSEILFHEFRNINDIEIKEVARKNIMSSKSQNRKNDKIEILIYHSLNS